MSFRGEFNWIQCLHQGGRKAISFTLKCTNMFQTETFDAAIIDGNGQLQPMMFRQQRLAANKSLRFDFDTVGWDWCQGDTFAIIDKKGQMDKKNKWTLNLRVPAPGECRECHGTHKCKYCNGTGMITNHRQHEIESCTACHGTGVCQNCYVPFRNGAAGGTVGMGSTYNPADMPNPSAARQHKADSLRQRIQELQAKLERAEWDERIMKLRGTDVSSRRVYMSQVGLKYQYERQLSELQYELQQLERL